MTIYVDTIGNILLLRNSKHCAMVITIIVKARDLKG